MNINKYIICAMLPAAMFCSCSKTSNITLETATVEIGDINETVTATGTVESVTQVDVGTQVTGIISQLYVDYNSEVKQGQLIAEIEKVLLESELTSANANMESARLTYEYNKTNYNRDKALHDKQLISDYEFETTKKEYEVSKTAYEKAQADRVKAAKNLNYAEIYSPIDGVVISRDVEVGQTVVSNMTVANLFTIADLNNMQVVANVDEADIGQVKVGQRVTFSVDAYPDDKFDGTVTQVRLSPTTESNVVTYEVIVAAPNPELKLIPGLTANLTIYTTEENNTLLIPYKALRFTPHAFDNCPNLPEVDGEIEEVGDDVKRVWLVEGKTLKPVIVEIGASNSTSVSIKSGLKQGDVIALEYGAGTQASTESSSSDDSSTETSPFAPTPPGKKK